MLDFIYVNFSRLMFLAVRGPGITEPGDVGPPPVGNGIGEIVGGAGEAAAAGGFNWGFMLVVYAVIFGAFYFLFLRPQRKREARMKEQQAKITTGDYVITTGGLFGKVADVGEDCFIIDFGTNRTFRVPVLKSDVLGIREPKMTPQPKPPAE